MASCCAESGPDIVTAGSGLWRELVPGPRSWIYVAGCVVTFGLLLGAPRIADALDRRGLPGGPIALGILLIAAASVLWMLTTMQPRSWRRRAVMRWARHRGAPFRSGFSLPASLREVTSLRGLASEGGVANLVVLEVEGSEILVFDRWRAAAVGYERAEWRTAAALRVPIDVPRVAVQPRRHGFRMPEGNVGLSPVGSESGAFDRRFRVLARDRAAAVTIVDPRLMAWLLDGPRGIAYEAAGAWLVCSRRLGPVRDRDVLVRAVLAFRDHLPRVSMSLYPAPDPGSG